MTMFLFKNFSEKFSGIFMAKERNRKDNKYRISTESRSG